MTKFWPVKHKRNTSEDYKKALLFLIKKKRYTLCLLLLNVNKNVINVAEAAILSSE